MIKNKKREQITSLTFRRHRQTPNNLKRVMLTPAGANHLLYSWLFLNFGEFPKQESKRTLHNMSVISLQLCYHTQFRFRVLHC